MASIDSALLSEYADLSRRRRRLEDDLAPVKARLAELEAVLVDQFVNAGCQRQTVNGTTIYLHRQLWAGAVEGDHDRACEALVHAGLGEYVSRRFNTNSLSAYVREEVKRHPDGELRDPLEVLPPEFKGAIKVDERVSLRATRG